MGQKEPSQWGNAKSCTGDEHHHAPVMLEADHLESSFDEKDLQVLVDNLYLSQ